MRLVVREAEQKDLTQIKYLFDNYISQDFYTLEELEDMLCREDDLLYVAADEDEDNKVVSCFYAFLSPLDEALRVLHIHDKPDVLHKYAENERVGVYKTTATDPEYRKRGLFSDFMTDLQPVLRDKGAAAILTTALRPFGKEIPFLKTLKETAFVPIQTLSRPWAEKKGYCPYCRQDYCICDAVFYIREFDREGDQERV